MTTDWELRYQTGDMPWDKGEPSPGLVDFLASHRELAAGRVLVPGCGTGHDVRAWAERGFQVTGLDLAPSAVRMALDKTPESLRSRIHFQAGDFLEHHPVEPFDWLFEHTLYCAIHPVQRDTYCEAVARWLKSGGNFLAVHYLIPDQDGPPFGTTAEEVLTRFSRHFTLLQAWEPRSYPNRQGRERVFWWRKS